MVEKQKIEKHKSSWLLLVLCILVVIVMGFAYAWLTKTLPGTKKYELQAGNLSLLLNEASSASINISEASPMADVDGLAQTTKFTFTLKNQGNITSHYEIYLDDDTIDSGDTRLAASNVKFSLDKNTTVGTAKRLSDLGNNLSRILDQGEIAAGATNTYALRLWLASDASLNIENQVFSGKLRIEARQTTS